MTSAPPTVNETSWVTFATPPPASTYGRSFPSVGTMNLRPATPKVTGCLTWYATFDCVCDRNPAMLCAAAPIVAVATSRTIPTSPNT